MPSRDSQTARTALRLIPAALVFALLLAFAVPSALPSAAPAAAQAATASGWRLSGGKWYYFKSGRKQTGWLKDAGKWYYLDPKQKGAAAKGLRVIGGKGYLFGADCAMKVNAWMNTNNQRYHSDEWGVVQTGWQKISGKWYYFRPAWNGAAAKGLCRIDGKGYLFGADYAMRTNAWMNTNGHRYHSDEWGVVQTGWRKIADCLYYFGKSGAMYTGKKTIDGKVFRFRADGVFMRGTGKTVVLDPGHSGVTAEGTVPLGPGSSERKDADSPGTRGVETGVYEYELNLTMAFKIKKELESRGYTVFLTRSDSSAPHDCIERAEVANSNGADIFVRLHANNKRDHSATGAMTICITPDNPFVPQMYQRSRLLSEKLLNCYVRATGCVWEEIWETDTMTGNNWSKVPTTLIEFGYMSNPGEDRKMQTASYQAKMTLGTANGIDAYFEAIGR
ncbi:MAG: N-acetylmuramoyl-L-alanine amidase [Lachnospiraceae bacterium]|nr:N-acetylmuramoyl-L-alanine amidase [Lachnospiraceae bacterium]